MGVGDPPHHVARGVRRGDRRRWGSGKTRLMVRAVAKKEEREGDRGNEGGSGRIGLMVRAVAKKGEREGDRTMVEWGGVGAEQ